MPYDRKKAMAYAKTYWDQPCDDGYFWNTGEKIFIEEERKKKKAPAKDGWVPRFVRDGTGGEDALFIKPNAAGVSILGYAGTWDTKLIHGWAGLADCAHYLSKCLSAGGVSIAEIAVSVLVRKLQSRADTKTLVEKVPTAAAQRVIDSGIFKEGDMIGYFNTSPHGDYGRANSYTHSTMFVGKDGGGIGRITCHTKSRYMNLFDGDDWTIGTDYKYTLIHISSDDAPLTSGTTTTYAGWYEVGPAAAPVYYKLGDKGTFAVTRKKPKAAGETAQQAFDTGYWFASAPGVIAFGKTMGDVIRFDLTAALSAKLNGAPVSATKLF